VNNSDWIDPKWQTPQRIFATAGRAAQAEFSELGKFRAGEAKRILMIKRHAHGYILKWKLAKDQRIEPPMSGDLAIQRHT